MDYNAKIYVNPIREKEGTKPHLQEHAEVEKWVGYLQYKQTQHWLHSVWHSWSFIKIYL